MCGIIASIGNQNVTKILIEGLERMQSRGYDSSGIAVINENQEIEIQKHCGELNILKKHLETNNLSGKIGIGHNRWATSGSDINDKNAHPHFSEDKKIALVHNGIIENHKVLKAQLIAKGHIFNSETDSEVIVHLIEEHYQNNLLNAVHMATKQIIGTFAIAVIHSDNKDEIVLAKKASPLVLGFSETGAFVASESSAISKYTQKHHYMLDDEFALVKINEIQVFDKNLKTLPLKLVNVEKAEALLSKNGYKYFMEKEIFQQSTTLQKELEAKIKNDSVILDEVKLSLEEIKAINRIQIIACGSSWNAALLAKHLIEDLLRIPVEVEVASEFRYKNPIIKENDLLIFISQSGETADTLASLKEAKNRGAKCLSIVNVKNSSIARHSDMVIYTNAGIEVGVASTKTFSAQLLSMYLFTIYLGEKQKILDHSYRKSFLDKLKKTVKQVSEMLATEKKIDDSLKYFENIRSAIFISRGINVPIAREAALKIKELAYISTETYPSGELKHGPIALIDENCPVIAICTDGKHYVKICNNIEEVRSRNGVVITIATEANKEIKELSDFVIFVPKAEELFSPIINTVAIQLLSLKIAAEKGLNVDKPRNLAKSVTVE